VNTVRCTISFLDGTQLKLVWEKQKEAALRSASLIEKVLNSESFAVELEGRLVIVPIQNIRTMEVSPAPEKLPQMVVRGARLA
jgi:hypothetical protein